MRVTDPVICSPNTDLLTKIEFPASHQRAIFAEELPSPVHLPVLEFSRVSGIAVIVKRIAQLRLSQTFQQIPTALQPQQRGQPSMPLLACPRL